MKTFAECNHAPVVGCNGDTTKDVIHLNADPGANVKLSARGTSDPDGDALSCRWWVYRDAGTYRREVPIRASDTLEAGLSVPADASGRALHVILTVTDDGSPPLTQYRRVVVDVSGEPQPEPEDVYLTTPITQLGGPPAETGTWSFFRGININGPALVIDGNPWAGDDAADFVCKDAAIDAPHVPLRPSTDDSRARMIHSFRWGTAPRVVVTNVPAGTYAVYAYAWEDNNPENFTISLNGQVVQRNYHSGVTGEWHRLGPWSVDVGAGSLELTSYGGAANLSGLEVWRRTP